MVENKKLKSIKMVLFQKQIFVIAIMLVAILLILEQYVYKPVMDEFKKTRLNAVVCVVEDLLFINTYRAMRNIDVIAGHHQDKDLLENNEEFAMDARLILNAFIRLKSVFIYKNNDNYVIVNKMIALHNDKQNKQYKIIVKSSKNGQVIKKNEIWTYDDSINKFLRTDSKIVKEEIDDDANLVKRYMAHSKPESSQIQWSQFIRQKESGTPNIAAFTYVNGAYIGIEESFAAVFTNLERYNFGKGTQAVLITNFGEMLKVPLNNVMYESNETPDYSFVESGVLPNESIKAGYAVWGSGKKNEGAIRSYSFDNKTWLTQYSTAVNPYLDWTVGVFSPENEIIPANIEWGKGVIFIIISIIAFAMFASYTITSLFSQTLGKLLTVIRKVAKLELSENFHDDSKIKEINEFMHEFNTARTLILNYTDTISYQNKSLALRLDEVLANLPMPISIEDKSKRYVSVNKKWEQYFGLNSADVIGKTAKELRLPFSHIQHEVEEKVIEEAKVFEIQMPIFKGMEEEYFISLNVPLFKPDGSLESVCTILNNITNQKRIEKSLIGSKQELEIVKEQYKSILDNANAAVSIKNPDGFYKLVNKYWCKYFGLKNEDVIGKSDIDIFPQEIAQLFIFNDQKSKRSAAPVTLNQSITLKGIQKDLLSLKFIIKNENNKLSDVCDISTDISDLNFARREIEKARVAAEDATRAKSAFLANMSHEIRTPMNSIIGFSDLCLNTDLTPKLRDYIAKINLSAQSLLTIINDILDFSKIESGQLHLTESLFNLNDLIDNAISAVAINAQTKGIKIIKTLGGAVPKQYIGDSGKMRQILVNLLNNAVKFTEKGAVTLKVDAVDITNDHIDVQIAIKDTGIGIDSHDFKKLFIPFSQIDNSLSRQYSGTGLGLSIVKEYVDLLKGEIQLESTLGIGSTFTIKIPLKKAKVSAEDMNSKFGGNKCLIVDEDSESRLVLMKYLSEIGFDVFSVSEIKSADEVLQQEINILILVTEYMDDKLIPLVEELKKADKDLFIFEVSPSTKLQKFHQLNIPCVLQPLTQSALFDVIIMAGKRGKFNHNLEVQSDNNARIVSQDKVVLIVEDNEINLLLVSEMVSSMGIKIDTAINGVEAIEKLNHQTYDAILMDIQMPVMDGIEATKRIRESSNQKDVPIIALTANAMAGDKEEYLQQGMTDYISKPIDINELKRVLTHYLLS